MAYHTSQQSRDEQVAFIREHTEIKKLEVVVQFLAGFSELGRDLWEVVRGFTTRAKPRYSLLEEDTNLIKLEILHLLFESEDPSVITGVLSSDYVCFSLHCSKALPLDSYVLRYCITHSSCNWKLELRHCKLESVELLLRALKLQQNQCQLPSTGKLKEVWLRLSKPGVVQSLVNNMPQILVFHNLTHLNLMCNGLGSETCNLLSKQTALLQHLEYLN